MAHINIKAIQNGDENDIVDVTGDMSPQEFTDLYFNIIRHMVKFKDEDELHYSLHMLIMNHMKGEE